MTSNLIVMLMFGFFGLLCHWFKRWSRRQTKNNFIDYMRNHRPSTIASVGSMAAAVFALSPAEGVELTEHIVGLAWLAGYTIDSIVKEDPRR